MYFLFSDFFILYYFFIHYLFFVILLFPIKQSASLLFPSPPRLPLAGAKREQTRGDRSGDHSAPAVAVFCPQPAPQLSAWRPVPTRTRPRPAHANSDKCFLTFTCLSTNRSQRLKLLTSPPSSRAITHAAGIAYQFCGCVMTALDSQARLSYLP